MKKVGIILGVIAIGAVSLAANTVTYSIGGTVTNSLPVLTWGAGSGTWNVGTLNVGQVYPSASPTITLNVSQIDIPTGSNMTLTVANTTPSLNSWRGLVNLYMTNSGTGQALFSGGYIAANDHLPHTLATLTTEPQGGTFALNFVTAFSNVEAPTDPGPIAIQMTFTGTVQSN